MHLAQRLAAVVLTLGLSAGLVGCGFHLKGTNPTATPLVYKKLSLELPAKTDDLETQLKVYLTANGVQLTNDNDAVHCNGVDELTHGVDRRAIALILLAAAYPTAGSECCCLGDTNQFHCQVAVRKIRRIFGHV